MMCPILLLTAVLVRVFHKHTCCGCPREECEVQGFANFLTLLTFVFVSLISKKRADGTGIPQNVFWETLPRTGGIPKGFGQELHVVLFSGSGGVETLRTRR